MRTSPGLTFLVLVTVVVAAVVGWCGGGSSEAGFPMGGGEMPTDEMGAVAEVDVVARQVVDEPGPAAVVMEGRLLVRVVGPGGGPVARAAVLVQWVAQEAGVGAFEAETDGMGVAMVRCGLSSSLDLHVNAQGYTTVRRNLVGSLVGQAQADPAVVDVVLWPASTLRVLVRDDRGRVRERHPVRISYQGPAPGSGGLGREDADHAGLQTSWVVWTERGGVAEVAGLYPGIYDLAGLPFRECVESGHLELTVAERDLVSVELTLETLAPETVASGVVQLPTGVVVSGLLRDYILEVQGQEGEAGHGIHEDGSFYLAGNPGMQFVLRVRELSPDGELGTRRSAWFVIQTGQQGLPIRLHWQD